MGAGRSLEKLHWEYLKCDANETQIEKPPTTKKPTINTWSLRYAWVARAARFDELEDAIRLETWRVRRLQLQEDDYKLGGDMRSLAGKILEAGPNFIHRSEKITADGTKIVTVKLSIQDLRSMADLGSKLQRMAAGEPTERVGVEIGESSNQYEKLVARIQTQLAETIASA